MDRPVSRVDGQVDSPSHFMLYHYDAAGAVDRERLLLYLPHSHPTTYQLMNDAAKETSASAQEAYSPDHSIASIELHRSHATLAVFQETENGSWILPLRSEEPPFRIPVSSQSSKTLVVLRRGDQFTTSSGRWSITLTKGSSLNLTRDTVVSDTHLRPSTSLSVSIPSPPSQDTIGVEDNGLQAVEQHIEEQDLPVAETRQPLSTQFKGQTGLEGLIGANDRLHTAARTVVKTEPFPILNTTNTDLSDIPRISDDSLQDETDGLSKPAGHNNLNSRSAITIRAEISGEDASPSPEMSQKDKHLTERSINLLSAGENKKDQNELAKEPDRSKFGSHRVQTASKEIQPTDAFTTSEPLEPPSPPPRQEIVHDVPNTAVTDAAEKHPENSSIHMTTRRSRGKKQKAKTFSTVPLSSPSKKRKMSNLSERSEAEDDSIDAVQRPAESTLGTGSRKSKASPVSAAKKPRKGSANGSPSNSTTPSTTAHQSPSLLDTTPSGPKSKRASSAKVYQGPPPKIIFSNSTTIDSKNNIMDSFRSFGGSVVKSINKANILCVPSGALKKTTKFIMAVALGKHIVDERWLVESHSKRLLLDPGPFLPKDVDREREWGFQLKAAIARGKSGLTNLLNGTPVYFTRQLEIDLGGNFKDFCKIAEILGGANKGVNVPAEIGSEKPVIVIGVDHDPEAPIIRLLGLRLHHRDLLVMGALRGVVDLESDDFVVEVQVKSETDG